MKTTIYYFSATGNNLSIAKKLKEQLGNTEIKSMAKLLDKSVIIDSESVGFVFPIYAWGMPLIVKEFIESATFKNVKYTFAITGCGGIAGKTMIKFKQLLLSKGQNLKAGFILSEPSNGINMASSNLMHKFIISIKGNRNHRTIEERMSEVIDVIKNKKNVKLEKDSFAVNQISNFINGLAVRMFKTQDKYFWTTDKCTSCGICSKICPRDNISIVDGKPKWNHNCEYCTACIHWCPNQAIEFGELSKGQKRYHKEEIEVNELM